MAGAPTAHIPTVPSTWSISASIFTFLLQGTLRTNDSASREMLVRRLKEIVKKTAEVFGGSAEIEMISQVPPLVCDPVMTDEMAGYMKELPIPGLTPVPDTSASASEDFAAIAEKVSSVFMYLSAGYTDERGGRPCPQSMRTSVPSAPPAWRTARSAGWKNIPPAADAETDAMADEQNKRWPTHKRL